MKITASTIENLAALVEWHTASEVSALRDTTRCIVVKQLKKLLEAGLIESKMVKNKDQINTAPLLVRSFRRTQAGEAEMETYAAQIASKQAQIASAQAQELGKGDLNLSGPYAFDWRNFKQPCPAKATIDNRHKPTSENSKLGNYQI